jgi:hypothetical protein
MKQTILLLVLIGSTAGVWAQKRTTRKQQPAKARTTPKPAAKQQPKKTATVVKKPVAAVETREPGDTFTSKTVVITSSFKPALRNAAKVNFSAASPQPDSTLPRLQYNVPSQNLFFSYDPATLKPLALAADTSFRWANSHFIKAGFGNYSTPYLQAGFSFGDGTHSVVNVHARHTSSKGSLPFQQFSKTGADVIGIFKPNDKIEWSGKVFFDNNVQYQYGFQPSSLVFTKDSLRQRFTTVGATVGLRNRQENEYGFNYSPNLTYSRFVDNKNGTENNLVVNAPFSKSFGDKFAFNLGVTADITGYQSDSVASSISNNLYYLTPAVQYKTAGLKLVAGFIPSWDNSAFHLLPNFTAEAKISDEKFILQAGWTGYYNKTTYQSLAAFNPWLQQPRFLANTRMMEQYAGFKGSAGNHITYNARVSYLKFKNQPLFVNDSLSGKSFFIVNESDMNALRFHSEIGYSVQEKFSLLGGVTYTQYSNLTDNLKAWGLTPFEINGSLRWEVLKDVMVKSDIYFWDGAQYRNNSKQNQKLGAAVDLNAGIEFGVMPRLNLWVQFNNMLNNKYQRWNQYEVLGFNVVGGIVYSFGQTGK